MDPLTASTTLATIVGLICNFKQEHSANTGATRQQFLEYLEYHRHEDLKNLICRTHQLSEEVDSLLREEHAVIISKLNAINELLATLISRVDGLSGFAHAFMPSADVSPQAVSILQQLVASTSDRFGELRMRGGIALHLVNGGQISYTEDRFLKDDLDKLCNLGLLTLEYGSSGNTFYRITRDAVKFVSTITPPHNEPNA